MNQDNQTTFSAFAQSNGKSNCDVQTENIKKTSSDTITPQSSASGKENTTHSSRFNTGDPLVDECLETMSGSDIEESSANIYSSTLRCYIWHLNKKNKSILDSEIVDFKDFLRDRVEAHLSKNTICVDISAIKKIYKYIKIETKKELTIDLFLLQELSVSDFNVDTQYEREPLAEDELSNLFDAANRRRDRLMMATAGETGGRNESIRILKISDVDLEEDEIELQNTKSGGKYQIPISSSLALRLERWIEVELSGLKTENEYIFPSHLGGYLETSGAFRNIVVEAAKRARIQEVIAERPTTPAEKRAGVNADTIQWYRVTPHTLRHTFSHLLDEAGLTTKQRRDALDHKNIQTTEVYTHSKSEYRDLIRDLLHDS